MNLSGIRRHSVIGRILRLPLRFIPDGTVAPILQVPSRGKKWIVGSSTHGCWLGSYEASKQQIFSDLVSPSSVVYDIGANVGFYTVLASVRGSGTGRVYAFEPLPRNIEYLTRHVKLNNLNNVVVFECALSDCTGVAKFEVAVNPSMGKLAEGSSDGVDVDIRTLDNIVSEHQLMPPNLMKVDIEGAEAAFLRGAVETISAHRPSILLATHGRSVHRECCDFLLAAGYSLQSLDRRPVDETDELLATA